MPEFDARDQELLTARIAARDRSAATTGRPLVGDFLLKPDGSVHRFTYDWGDGLQTGDADHGSYYLDRNGQGDYSGSLDPLVPNERITPTSGIENGRFWFFHHDCMGAHRGVPVTVPCRVFKLED